MLYGSRVPRKDHVALLAEGVDRNTVRNVEGVELGAVALLAEGVDRNSLWKPITKKRSRRPPRGGRG